LACRKFTIEIDKQPPGLSSATHPARRYSPVIFTSEIFDKAKFGPA
jgi:hypothetical protein